MLIELSDFLKMRSDQGQNWPGREDIYQMKFHNHCGFADSGAIRVIGKRKLLIDPTVFEEWLEKAAIGGQHG